MIDVRKDNWSPEYMIEVVHQLRSSGLVQNIDFDFRYYPPDLGSYLWEETAEDRHVVFTFYKPELATWFSLRY